MAKVWGNFLGDLGGRVVGRGEVPHELGVTLHPGVAGAEVIAEMIGKGYNVRVRNKTELGLKN